ncbi:MAG: hypothetical protein ACJ8CR_24790 [Roseiflexaceae bacterium]
MPHQPLCHAPRGQHIAPAGTPTLANGYVWANDKPGWGVDIDEAAAAKYPIEVKPIEWTQSRWPDGTIWTP